MREINETRIIARVNDIAIVAMKDEQQLVPIKPICDALGINYPSQYKKIKDSKILSSTIVLSTTVGSDGKSREMVCIPLEFVFGWLFTINSENVSENVQETVFKYQMECYKALYKYFSEPQKFLNYKSEIVKDSVKEYQRLQQDFKNAQKLMNEAKKKMNESVDMTIEEWRDSNRQMAIPFNEID